jgi:predicted permease
VPAAFVAFIRVPSLETDWRVVAFVLLASAGAALLFGLVPAIQTTRSRLVEANRGDFSADHRPSRLRSFLIVVQVTVCALLMICSGIALRSQHRVAGQDIRMRTQGVFNLILSKGLRPDGVDRLRASPGIEDVAAVWRAPIESELVKLAVAPSGSTNEVLAGYNFVSPEYFSMLRIPLLRGRLFTADESRSHAGVVVISEATAQHFWPGRNPLGESISILAKRQKDGRSDRLPAFSTARVIGVVGDVMSGYAALQVDSSCLYFPTAAGYGPDSLMVSVPGSKQAGRHDIEAALDRISPGLAEQINALDDIRLTMIYPFRVAFWIAGFLGALALMLTASGIYGVLSYLVNQRTKEIGIRMALGAGTGAVVRMVMSQCLRLVLIGIAAGGGLAMLFAPLFQHEVEAIQPYDAAAYIGAIAVVAVAALAASLRPAQRAVAVEPISALRCD